MQQANPQQADVAYAAGFFDGEGSTAVYVGSGMNNTGLVYAVSCWQNQDYALGWLADNFGGAVYNRPSGNFEWRVTGAKAHAFLVLVLPFLKVKEEDATIMIATWQSRNDHTLRDSLIEEKRRAAAETKWRGAAWKSSDAIVRSEGIVQPSEMAEMTIRLDNEV